MRRIVKNAVIDKRKSTVTILCGVCLGVVFAVASCNKRTDANEIEGIYVGTYTWTNLTRNFSFSSTPTIELREGKYTYKGLSDDSYYDSGSGNFTIKGNKITFELTYYPIPMEDIGVVDSWLLKGEYKYKFDGNKLSFSKTSKVMADKCRYEFELKKN